MYSLTLAAPSHPSPGAHVGLNAIWPMSIIIQVVVRRPSLDVHNHTGLLTTTYYLLPTTYYLLSIYLLRHPHYRSTYYGSTYYGQCHVQALTSTEDTEITICLNQLKASAAGAYSIACT